VNSSLEIKVALVTMTENYEGMRIAPPSFINEDRKNTISILNDIGVEIVLDELVYNSETARVFVSKLKSIIFDLLIVNIIGWAGGDAIITIAQNQDAPLILWTSPTTRMALCGYFEATSDLKSIGKSFKPIIGKGNDAIREIKSYVKAIAVAKKLKGMKIGQIGYPPPGWIDAIAKEVDLRAKIGVEIVHLDVSEIFSELEKIANKESESEYIHFLKSKFNQMVAKEELVKSIKVSMALDRVVKLHDLKGAALRCLPELQSYSYPCIGVSKLSDEGIPIACEGDLPAAITSVILYELTGNPPAVFDCDSIDPKENLLRLWHCGHLATKLAIEDKKIDIIPPTYFGGITGSGAILSFPVKPGKVTLAKLSTDGEKMLIASGETIIPEEQFTGAYAEVKLDCNATDLVRMMTKEGIEHHICLVHGNVVSELNELCEILRIRPVRCET